MSDVTAPTTLMAVVPEPLTAKAFAPYGEVISTAGRESLGYDLYGDRDDNFVAGSLESDHHVEVLLTRQHIREYRINFLERHFEIAQAFIPLGGNPFLCVVARPDAPEEHGLPRLDEVRAFWVPGDAGLTLHRGTWHEPPFPLSSGATMVVTSHRALTEALGSTPDENGEIHWGDVDKRHVTSRTGVELRIQLP